MAHYSNSKTFYRRAHLLILCMAFGCLSKAQYLPVVVEGKYWVLKKYGDSDIPHAISAYALVISGDTLVNSLAYKKVYLSFLAGSHPCPPPQFPCFVPDFPYRALNKELVSLIREDTLSKMVYNLPIARHDFFCDTIEYLVFDFSLEMGNVLNKCVYEAIGGGSFGFVDSTGVYELYDNNRNTLYTTGYQTYLGLPPIGAIRIMEGIGFENYGVFHDPRSELIDFCAGGAQSCEILSSTTVPLDVQTVTIFPNPSKGVFHVQVNEGRLKCIRVYNTLGVLKKEVWNANTVDMAMFENGVYIVELIDSSGRRLLKIIHNTKN